jgi:hypothetical protein
MVYYIYKPLYSSDGGSKNEYNNYRYEKLQAIDAIGTWTDVANENGLFTNQDKIRYEDVQGHLCSAKNALESREYNAEHYVSLTLRAYYDALLFFV